MRIHLGCELHFEFPQPTPLILTLNVHFSRVSELERPSVDASIKLQGSR